jgi:CBS domain-containing protein
MTPRRRDASRTTFDASSATLWLGLAAVATLAFAFRKPARRWMGGRVVGDVMVSDVVTIGPSASLSEAARTMRDANVGVLPVVRPDRTLHGIITDRDIVVRAVAEAANADTVTVGECATRALACARPSWDVDRAMEVMSSCQIGRLPVVDDANRVVGIVTLSSVALRGREDDEALDTARDVSRRSARDIP